MSAIPWVGQDIVEFIWGGFSVNNATLNRFFALHFVLPFVLAALALMHLIALHDSAGSGNPLGVSGNSDRLPFAPYFIFKDLITIFIFILALSIFVFFMPNVLGDSENYVMANPMQTPPAIVPEWYLLPFYAILRSIPNKLLGVIAMFSAILILLTMPFTDLSKTRGIQFRPLSKVAFFIFIGNFLILMQLGAKHVESPFIEFGQICTVLYFAHFLIIVPFISLLENSLIELASKDNNVKHYSLISVNTSSHLMFLYFIRFSCDICKSLASNTNIVSVRRYFWKLNKFILPISFIFFYSTPDFNLFDKLIINIILIHFTILPVILSTYFFYLEADWHPIVRSVIISFIQLFYINCFVKDVFSELTFDSFALSLTLFYLIMFWLKDRYLESYILGYRVKNALRFSSCFAPFFYAILFNFWPDIKPYLTVGDTGGFNTDLFNFFDPDAVCWMLLIFVESLLIQLVINVITLDPWYDIVYKLKDQWTRAVEILIYLILMVAFIFAFFSRVGETAELVNQYDATSPLGSVLGLDFTTRPLGSVPVSILLPFFYSVHACDAPRPWGLYFQDSATPQMEGLVELHDNILFYLVIILFGVGWILASIIRSYKSIESPISHKYLSHGTLIELIWTITPALILILIAFPSFKLLYLMDEVSDPAMAILAEGHQWYWSYQYPDFLNSDDEFIEFDSYLVPESDLEDGALRMLEVDNRLIIPELTHVRFIVTGADVIHSFACPALGIKCDAYPGRLNQVSVMINREGTFYGQCSEICGILHSSMPIVIESVSIEKFVAWLLDQ